MTDDVFFTAFDTLKTRGDEKRTTGYDEGYQPLLRVNVCRKSERKHAKKRERVSKKHAKENEKERAKARKSEAKTSRMHDEQLR